MSRYAVLSAATIAAGLLVHFAGGPLPAAARDILGDALWAAMIYWLISWVRPRAAPLARATTALAICFAVELSQLIRAGWLDALRATSAGHLVLGSDFDARDLLAYAAGIAVAAAIDRSVIR